MDEDFNNEFEYTKMPGRDLNLFAKWERLIRLSFESNGSNSVGDLLGLSGESITLPTPQREKNTFLGWYLDSELINKFNLNSMPNDDTVLHASWQPYPILSFNSNGGTNVDEIIQVAGSTINLEIPFKEGYSFDGWYLDEELSKPFDRFRMPNQDTTLYAKWDVFENVETLIINYYREDKIYANWDVWLWQSIPTVVAGRAFDFTDENDLIEAVRLIIDMNESGFEDARLMGFVIRQADWTKDYDNDLFIDLSRSKDGVVEIFVFSGHGEIFYSIDDLMKHIENS